MKKTTRARGKGRMRAVDVAPIIAEIEAYRAGKRSGPLTWAKIVEFSGFSHVSLWSGMDCGGGNWHDRSNVPAGNIRNSARDVTVHVH